MYMLTSVTVNRRYVQHKCLANTWIQHLMSTLQFIYNIKYTQNIITINWAEYKIKYIKVTWGTVKIHTVTNLELNRRKIKVNERS